MKIFTSSSYGRALFAAVLLVLGLTGTHPVVPSVERHPCSVPQALGLRRSVREQGRLVLRGGGRKKEERKTEDDGGPGPEAEALGLGGCATKTVAMKRQPRKRKSAPTAVDTGARLHASERGEEGDGAVESDGNGKGPVGGLLELGSLLASPSKLLSSGEQFETPVSALLGVSPAGMNAADAGMFDASREATVADTSEKSSGRKARGKTTGPPTPRKPQTPRKQKDSAASEAATTKPPKKLSPGKTRGHPAAEYACREKQAQAQAEKDWEERDWQGPESGVKNADGSLASPWMDQDEIFALPGVSCCPLPACESPLGGPATAEYKDLISFPRTPAPREDEVVTITNPEQMVGIERMKYGLAGYQTGPSPELLRDLKHNGEPGLWNSSDPEEQARTWRPFSELWLPGHETFKYYKDGKYTGELYDQKTREYWARIANIYAPNTVGLPQIFIDDKAERVGTLDWSVIKDRPATALDPLLKSTYWYTPDTGDLRVVVGALCLRECVRVSNSRLSCQNMHVFFKRRHGYWCVVMRAQHGNFLPFSSDGVCVCVCVCVYTCECVPGGGGGMLSQLDNMFVCLSYTRTYTYVCTYILEHNLLVRGAIGRHT